MTAYHIVNGRAKHRHTRQSSIAFIADYHTRFRKQIGTNFPLS